MPARAPKARGEMRPARPSAANRIAYQRALESLIDEMHRSTLYWLRSTYRQRENEIALDASPAADLAAQLRRRANQWRKMFADRAPDLARWFISKVDRHATNATKQAAVALTGMSVSTKDTLVANTVLQASVQENVSLIRSIQSEYATEVEGLVMRSVTAERDLAYLTDQLQERYGVTRRRARLIAGDQNNKATAQMARVRQMDLGITKARWLHVGGGKNPRHSHVEANGKVFDLKKGLKIDGEYIFPANSLTAAASGHLLSLAWTMKTNKSEVLLAFDKSSVRRTDSDGRLFLETSRISKAGVNPYWGREIPKYDELGLDPDKVYQVFRPPEELEKAAHTFNNIPILAIHTHVTAQNPKKEVIIGSTGSTSAFDGEYLNNGLGFWDAEYIGKINSEEQRELSSSYRYIPILENGSYNGSPYDIKMTQIEGNHVALVVEGRAGPDVLVADSKIHHPVKGKSVKLNPKQKTALKAHVAKLVAMDEASLDTEAVEEALETAIEEVQALGESTETTTDADAGRAEVVALLKQLLEKMEGGTSAADDEAAKTAEAAKKAEAAKNAAAMDAKIKDATDGVRASIEGRFKAAEKVSPITGKLDAMAFDSADAIFAHALKVGGMKPEDHKPEAYSGIVDVLIANRTPTPVHTASDAAAVNDLLAKFPAIAKINHA